MKIGDLRAQLQARNARWFVPETITDDQEIQVISKTFALGGNMPRPGAMTTRFPRMRRAPERLFLPWQPDTHRFGRAVTDTLPPAWDWRNVAGKNWVTPVKDQQGCGTCVVFAVAGSLEIHQRIANNDPDLDVDVSEAALFFINERQCLVGEPRYGWAIPYALDFLVDAGVCAEEQYPYRGVNQEAELVAGSDLTLKITGYDSTTRPEQMKRWLVEEGPLIAMFTVYSDFFTYWSTGANGVYTYDRFSPKQGLHVVPVIGFDEAQSCWICKNSWGPTFNNEGFFRIGYGECGVDSRMYLMQDVYEVYTRDELVYDPAKLRIVDEGARGWLLTDGVNRLKLLDTKEDARNALRVARRHTTHGFIGRENPRRNPEDYITEYWSGTSGLPHEPLTKVDTINYNPNNVVAVDRDEHGWQLRQGNQWLLMADDLNDALALMRVVERHTRMGFIGRENTRPNRKAYILTYWE